MNRLLLQGIMLAATVATVGIKGAVVVAEIRLEMLKKELANVK